MFELTINGTVYEFNFGIGFVKEINKMVQKPVDGVPGIKEDMGLTFAIAKIIDGDVVTLINVLDMANKRKDPRITKAMLEEYVDDEDTDIDGLFDQVMGFFRRSNATKKTVQKITDAVMNAEN